MSPVSYTHLDVYKRQAVRSTLWWRNLRAAPACCWFRGRNALPVSYTHLLYIRYYSKLRKRIAWREIWQKQAMYRFFPVNRDIFFRTPVSYTHLIEHTGRIIQILTGPQTDQTVMCFGIFFIQEMNVICTNQLDIELLGICLLYTSRCV